MNSYSLRKNYISHFSSKESTLRAKLAFKTKDTKWLNAEEPVIILLSVHSALHEKFDGHVKMDALIATVKNNIRGKTTILIADEAHVKTMSLFTENAREKCFKNAQELHQRYNPYFEGCKVVYWHSYICQDESYELSLNRVKQFYRNDSSFRQLLCHDAESSYTEKRMREFPNKPLFIKKAVEEILEQCACILVLSKKGYRFQFYPGKSYASTEYINQILLSERFRVTWINVFLAIEKKTITLT